MSADLLTGNDAQLDAYLASKGMAPKERCVSIMLIREDAPGTLRVMCLDCLTHFDLFGVFNPADALGESSIVQRCIEHLQQCDLKRSRVLSTQVFKNLNSPIYKLSVRWST